MTEVIEPLKDEFTDLGNVLIGSRLAAFFFLNAGLDETRRVGESVSFRHAGRLILGRLDKARTTVWSLLPVFTLS